MGGAEGQRGSERTKKALCPGGIPLKATAEVERMGVLRRTQRRRQSVGPQAARGWGPAGRRPDPKSQNFSLKDSLELAELLLRSALRVSARFASKPRGEAAFRPAPSSCPASPHPRVCLSYPQSPVESAGGACVSAAEGLRAGPPGPVPWPLQIWVRARCRAAVSAEPLTWVSWFPVCSGTSGSTQGESRGPCNAPVS